MNKIFFFIGLAPVLILIELAYFKLARHFNIIDKPNNRSLHEKPTIRGGGIVFPVAIFLLFPFGHHESYFFIIAVLLIAAVGLWDDLKSLSRLIRFGAQAVAMLLIFYDLQVFDHSWWIILILLIVAVGTVNAYNFMDGINGITGGYSLVVMMSLVYVNSNIILFVDNDLLATLIIALLVFSFFNFRKKAVCFAGDVGSLSVGIAIIYLILRLIMASHNYIFILFLAVYGVDSVLTIVHRLILKQNIFKAHKLHLYQVVISATGAPHLRLTFFYMLVQLMVNGLIIYNLDGSLSQQYGIGLAVLFVLAFIYIGIKRRVYQSPTDVL